jgi:hypothetical protein
VDPYPENYMGLKLKLHIFYRLSKSMIQEALFVGNFDPVFLLVSNIAVRKLIFPLNGTLAA